jgi:hypothetical protein
MNCRVDMENRRKKMKLSIQERETHFTITNKNNFSRSNWKKNKRKLKFNLKKKIVWMQMQIIIYHKSLLDSCLHPQLGLRENWIILRRGSKGKDESAPIIFSTLGIHNESETKKINSTDNFNGKIKNKHGDEAEAENKFQLGFSNEYMFRLAAGTENKFEKLQIENKRKNVPILIIINNYGITFIDANADFTPQLHIN